MHGWHILSVALQNKEKIVDLGNNIRDNKKYFYHEYDHVFLRESRDLNYNQFMFNNIVVPFNSDSLHDTSMFTGPVEQLVTTGTGLNWVLNLHKLGFSENTKVCFADANPLVLNFMRQGFLSDFCWSVGLFLSPNSEGCSKSMNGDIISQLFNKL